MPRKQEKFEWTFEDLAEVCGTSINTIYQARSRNEFDPKDFRTLFPFVARKGCKSVYYAMLDYMRAETAENPLVKEPRRRSDRTNWKKS
jgi:hypothetical protein